MATAASCAYSLAGASSVFGDTSNAAFTAAKESAILLCWACACFIVALTLIVAAQLLYTEIVIVEILRSEKIKGWQERIVRVAVGGFAWMALGFQTAAIFLMSQSLILFARGPVEMARYGIISGAAIVATVTFFGVTSTQEGKKKLLQVFTLGCKG